MNMKFRSNSEVLKGTSIATGSAEIGSGPILPSNWASKAKSSISVLKVVVVISKEIRCRIAGKMKERKSPPARLVPFGA